MLLKSIILFPRLSYALRLSIALPVAIAFSAAAFAAEDATMHQVYQAAQSGHFAEAQQMMDKVLKDKPNSAKAHYVEAELLAKQGQFDSARHELNVAEGLQPGLPFVKPQSVSDLNALIASSHPIKTIASPTNASPFSQSSGPAMQYQSQRQSVPWGMLLLGIGLIAFIVLATRFMMRRSPQAIPAYQHPGYGLPAYSLPPASTPANPYGYGASPAYPAAQPAPGFATAGGSGSSGMGSGGLGLGIMGGLATGAALGAGMVAGEELIHHFTDGNRSAEVNRFGGINDAAADVPRHLKNDTAQDDMGGQDFGVDDNSSWDDGATDSDDWS